MHFSMENFEVLKTLGRGAFGEAFLVRRRGSCPDGTSVEEHAAEPVLNVVKQVDLNRLTPTSRESALNEVGVLRQLSHPNIIAYYDTFVDSSYLSIVMEYADSGDLAGAIKQRREERSPYTEHDAMPIFSQCLHALKYIHSKHIIHRDLKPQNIFLTSSGTLKVGDFGISKVLEFTAAVAGTMIGTPSYLAPEICESRSYGTKVDIWSSGVVLYELVALRPPFQSNNLVALIMKISSSTPELPSTCCEASREVLSMCLTKVPEERPTAEEVLDLPILRSAGVDAPDHKRSMDQFEELKVLGRGAFGKAILVKEKGGGANTPYLVIKKVGLSSLDDNTIQSAMSEVNVLRQLSHLHIIAYFDAFIEDDHLNLILEFADGGDLAGAVAKRREEQKPYGDSEALQVLAQCLLALKYLHAKYIIHRDVKSQNVFLTKSKHVKLGDFGISKVLEHTAACAGTLVGTPMYLAPEICESVPYNSKADIWAVGVLLYEMVALKTPFQAATNLAALIMKIVTADPPPLPSSVGSEVRAIVDQVLQKQPDLRPSAAELLAIPCVDCQVKFSLDPAQSRNQSSLKDRRDAASGDKRQIQYETPKKSVCVDAPTQSTLESTWSMTADTSMDSHLRPDGGDSSDEGPNELFDSIDGRPKQQDMFDSIDGRPKRQAQVDTCDAIVGGPKRRMVVAADTHDSIDGATIRPAMQAAANSAEGAAEKQPTRGASPALEDGWSWAPDVAGDGGWGDVYSDRPAQAALEPDTDAALGSKGTGQLAQVKSAPALGPSGRRGRCQDEDTIFPAGGGAGVSQSIGTQNCESLDGSSKKLEFCTESSDLESPQHWRHNCGAIGDAAQTARSALGGDAVDALLLDRVQTAPDPESTFVKKRREDNARFQEEQQLWKQLFAAETAAQGGAEAAPQPSGGPTGRAKPAGRLPRQDSAPPGSRPSTTGSDVPPYRHSRADARRHEDPQRHRPDAGVGPRHRVARDQQGIDSAAALLDLSPKHLSVPVSNNGQALRPESSSSQGGVGRSVFTGRCAVGTRSTAALPAAGMGRAASPAASPASPALLARRAASPAGLAGRNIARSSSQPQSRQASPAGVRSAAGAAAGAGARGRSPLGDRRSPRGWR